MSFQFAMCVTTRTTRDVESYSDFVFNDAFIEELYYAYINRSRPFSLEDLECVLRFIEKYRPQLYRRLVIEFGYHSPMADYNLRKR